jgi:hypothetical protein
MPLDFRRTYCQCEYMTEMKAERLQLRIAPIVNGDFPLWRGRGDGPPSFPRP